MSKGLPFLIRHFDTIIIWTGTIAGTLFAAFSGPQTVEYLVSLSYWLKVGVGCAVIMFLGYKVLLPQLIKRQRRTEENGDQASR